MPPSGDATFAAAFRQQNPVVSLINALSTPTQVGNPDPGYNVFDDIRGSKYEAEHLSALPRRQIAGRS